MHKKPSETNESGLFHQAGSAFLSLHQSRLEKLAKLQSEMIRQIENMNQEFAESWNHNSACCRDMLSQVSANPSEASKICQQWLTEQFERTLQFNRKLSADWLAFMQNGVTALQQEARAPEREARAAGERKIEAVRTTPHQAAG